MMSTPTVRISQTSHRVLREISEKTGASMLAILDQALEDYRRKIFFQMMNRGYASLKSDPSAWAAMKAEWNAWDSTLMDGLDRNEGWGEDRRSISGKNRR